MIQQTPTMHVVSLEIVDAHRSLATIATEIDVALKTCAVTVGARLLEAKAHPDLCHGEWLRWLEVNFGLTERTAQNYMSAARLAAKYEIVADLKLRPTALYALAEMDSSSGQISEALLEAVLKEATIECVSGKRVREIASSLRPPAPMIAAPADDLEAAAAARRAEQDAEIAAILASPQEPAPDESPAPEPAPPVASEHDARRRTPAEKEAARRAMLAGVEAAFEGRKATAPDLTLSPFERAVETLARLRAHQPPAKFTGAKLTRRELYAVADFLNLIADGMEECA
jgi:hypothetical protein